MSIDSAVPWECFEWRSWKTIYGKLWRIFQL